MKNNFWTLIRICLYVIIILVVIIYTTKGMYVKCHFVEKLGITCPACGATRATISLLKGNLINAINYNAFYSLVIFPGFIFFMMEDIYIVIKRTIYKSPKASLIEILFGGNAL